MLREMAGDMPNDDNAFVREGAPAEPAPRGIAFWTGDQHWQAIDSDVAQTLRAVKATRHEIEVLVTG